MFYLGWPIVPSYVSPNAGGWGGGGGWRVSADEYSCAHRALINFGDLAQVLPKIMVFTTSPSWFFIKWLTSATEPFGWVTLQCYTKLEILRDRGSASWLETRTSRSLILEKGVSYTLFSARLWFFTVTSYYWYWSSAGLGACLIRNLTTKWFLNMKYYFMKGRFCLVSL